MLSTHRKFCEGIVTGLSGVRAYALAYPRCSLKTARLNASHLRAKPHIQGEIAPLRAQADASSGSAVLALIEKRRWLARVVRANLALLNPKIDGELLVSLYVDEALKKPHMRKICIADKVVAIEFDTTSPRTNLFIHRRSRTRRPDPQKNPFPIRAPPHRQPNTARHSRSP
jgi:hypothetical protein